MDVFPTNLLRVAGMRWRVGGAFTSGGEPIVGEPQIRRVDGGGRWVCDLRPQLLTDDAVRTWEALLMGWHVIDEKIEVPRYGGPLQLGGYEYVTHSDGSTFGDGSLYASGTVTASLVEPIANRATTAIIRSDTPITGGIFTMVGETYGARLHSIARVDAVDGDEYTVRFGPPAREAYAADTEVDFNNPRCTMRPVLTDEAIWPEYTPGYKASVGVSFVETERMT